MKNGYYMSTYLHIDELANLEDIILRHDQNVALWHKDGDDVELVHYWELERITGLKKHKKSIYDIGQAKNIINNLLKSYNLTLDDMEEVWGTPGLDTCNDYHSLLEYPDFTYHSVAHLFSAILSETNIYKNNNIIGLAVDGGSDNVIDFTANNKNLYLGCVKKGNNLQFMNVSSPAVLWFWARVRYNMEQGSLMALACASNSKAYIKVDDIMEIKNMKDIKKSQEWFNKLANKIEGFSKNEEGILFNEFDEKFSEYDNKISMLMKIIQEVSIKIIERDIDKVLNKYELNPKESYISMAGGYALNCPSNSSIMKKYKFKGFMGCPCVSDTGLSLGIGLYAFYKKNSNINFSLNNAYYGDSQQVEDNILYNGQFGSYIENISEVDNDVIVKDIIDDPIVWFDGRAEIGPRALGSRSLLADPRVESSKDKLNIIKQRQWWRPVAPIVLEEDIDEWFYDAYPSPFMLHTFKIKKEKIHLIPAIAHIDESSRVQTVDKNHKLYKLIRAFKKNTGIPLICNTSLNDKGEPIINNIYEALNFALRKNIKVVYANGKRIQLYNHDMYKDKEPLPRNVTVDKYDTDKDKKLLIKQYNPFDLSVKELKIIYNNPILRNKFDLTNKKDIDKVLKITKTIENFEDITE